jgi:hypothetical protein
MQTDNKALVECINRCFALSVNPDFSIEEQEIYQKRGFELRARLMTLLHAIFTEGTLQVKEANLKIKEVNKMLKERLQKLQNAADTIAAVSGLVSILDDLLKLPFAFF